MRPSAIVFLVSLSLLPAWQTVAAPAAEDVLDRVQKLRSQGQPDRAVELLAGVITSPEGRRLPSAEFARLQAHLDRLCFELLMTDQPQLAIVGLKALMAAGPAPAMRWAMLARAYVEAAEFRKAAETLKRGLRQHPRSAELLFVRAALAGSMSEQAVARASYAQARSMLRGAEGDLAKAVAVEPIQPGIHRALGKIRASLFVYCRATGRADEAFRLWAQAEEAYERAMALDPINPDLAYELAELHRAAGDTVWAETVYLQAEQRYRAMARRSPAPAVKRMARERAQVCRRRQAQCLMDRARRTASRHRFGRAKALLQEALERDEGLRATVAASARALEARRQRNQQRIARLHAARDQDENLLALGDLHREAGSYEQARKAYEAALDAPGRSLPDALLRARIASVMALPGTSLRMQSRIGEQTFVMDLPPAADAARLRASLEKAHALNQALFHHRLNGPVQLKVFVNRRAFQEGNDLSRRPRALGLYAFGRLMTFADPERGQAQWLEILSHELAHRYVDEMSYGKAPAWLSEGLAHAAMSHKAGPKKNAWRKRKVPWRLLEQRLKETRTYGPRQQELLRQAGHMVAWLLKRFGAQRMMTLLSMLRQGLPMDQAMHNAFGQHRGVLENVWSQELK